MQMTLTLSILTDIVGLALFVNWLLHWFSPIQKYRERLVEKLIRVMVKYNLYFAEPLITVFTCPYCLGFWSALIYFQNFTYALITSFLALSFNYIIKKFQNVEY